MYLILMNLSSICPYLQQFYYDTKVQKYRVKKYRKVQGQVIYLIAVPDKFQGVHNRFQLIQE
jgi:hypothetical protein